MAQSLQFLVWASWTTYYFIVRRLIGSGVLFLNLLGFCGSYQKQFQIYFLDGGIGWKRTSPTFGIWLHCTYYGLFGRNAISGLLRIWIVSKISCLLSLVVHYSTSLGLGDSQLVILSLLSFVLSSFVIIIIIIILLSFLFVFLCNFWFALCFFST